ncbi:carbamoyltransferase HypF [bacterium BMS3Abin05]|nr:carbamoyltransferase HypF [bacterium BMS3Abin05]GBE26935.1 carbamoyltransferase HypF [bacterium BMS3Bbin03]
MTTIRYKIQINGIVQGVGFRPFVYRLAENYELAGFVNNSGEGVLIEIEGNPDKLEAFLGRLKAEAPPVSEITDLNITQIPLKDETKFIIRSSLKNAKNTTLISPDIGLCEDCLRELFDLSNRRYRYPFINCTHCGPRYTIVYKIPYDRPNTSMRVFPMCPDCEREYHDPADRRFHAQPNACPVCGPQVSLFDRRGQKIETADPIESAAEYLHRGKIVAVRGLGGFHLAVDAANEASVRELRRRKGRAEKPFALMAPHLESIRKFCEVSREEEKLLRRQTRPIVLLRAKSVNGLARSIAPKNRYLGFMLPYTPLHHLILRDHFDALVMTSGNFYEEPIAIGNEEALDRLSHMADYFLLHDREILQRCDDSIMRIMGGKARVLRRARGFVPAPVLLEHPTHKHILACGAELKNTVALSRKNTIFISQHIGNLDNPAALDFFKNTIGHLQEILEITPEVIAYDYHPEYFSTKWALQQAGLPKIGIQHHHAHLASVMAENGVFESTIGIILDGTGFGTDGTIWGGEVLVGDAAEFHRCAWLEPFHLPGGTAAILQPWRTAVSVLYETFGAQNLMPDIPFIKNIPRDKLDVILKLIQRKINSPKTSSCGRLFDAVSSLLGICQSVQYEAQAAIELEMKAADSEEGIYKKALLEDFKGGAIPVKPLIRAIVTDLLGKKPIEAIAARFHRTLAELFLQAAEFAREKYGIRRVGLSGGVFQNVKFFEGLLHRLQQQNFEVLTHTAVPTNDGGLALGQVVIADAILRLNQKNRPQFEFQNSNFK